jgi:LacI family transcriptional regulator
MQRDMKAHGHVSLREIAVQAGVSRATVSRALRNHRVIPSATRSRIQAVAQRLGYANNPVLSTFMTHVRAVSAGKPLGTLAYLTTWPTRNAWTNYPTDRKCFQGAAERAAQSGYRLEEFWLKEPGMNGQRMTQVLQTRGIAGIVVAPLPFPPARGHLSLDWSRFAAVALGYSVWRPNLDRVASHYSVNVVNAVHQLRGLGYTRIGLALLHEMNLRLDCNVFSSFRATQQSVEREHRIPVLEFGDGAKRVFAKWFQAYRPEAVVSYGGQALTWMRELKARIPEEVGFVDLDLPNPDGACAGIDQHSAALAGMAVDHLLAQLNRNEYGIPALPRLILVEGAWVHGATVRARKRRR